MSNRAMQIEWIMLGSERSVMVHRALRIQAERLMEAKAETESGDAGDSGEKQPRKRSTHSGIEIVGPPLWVRRYKEGYILRRERWRLPGCGDNYEKECMPTEITAAYNLNGDYIGDAKTAHFLCKKYGIKPERREPDSNVCSIGFSEKKGGWCGWSHRAISCFKPGDTVKEGHVTAEYMKVGFTAKTMEDAKKMAKAFARGVS